jgi:hypothetical protein
MRWFMYRRPLAGVLEFGFCGNGEDEKQNQRRRPEASGTNGTSERTMSRCEPGIAIMLCCYVGKEQCHGLRQACAIALRFCAGAG